MKFGNFFIFFTVTIVFIILIVFVRNNNKVEIYDINKFKFNYVDIDNDEGNVKYSVSCSDKCLITVKYGKEENNYKVNRENLDGLEEVLKKYRLDKWNKFHKVGKKSKNIDSFMLVVEMSEGKVINAYGYGVFPDNYDVVREEFDSYFRNIIK